MGSGGEVEKENAEKAGKGSREGGMAPFGNSREKPPPSAVGSVGIADHAALCGVERRRNDPPPAVRGDVQAAVGGVRQRARSCE